MAKLIYIEGIGDVILVKSRQSKRISLVMKPFKAIRVTFPYWSTYKQALQIIYDKREWIIKSKQKINEVENRVTVFREDTTYQTKKHKLLLYKANVSKAIVRVEDNKIKVKYPFDVDIDDKALQMLIRNGIDIALHKEAAEYLPQRLEYLANNYNFNYRKLSLRNSKTRWGSCSSNNNINLSIHLMRLPIILIDFVILHELVHTKIKNHSKNFWDSLENITGDVNKLRKELRNFNISIY